MLDRLLGRASLKERIETLEAERDSLESRLEAESDRRSEAARKRQEAEARVNHLEDRIEELEDRVERAESTESDAAVRGEATLRGDRLDEVLSRLESVGTGPEGALSAMVEETLPDGVRETFGERTPLVEHAAPALVYADDAHLVNVAVRPPVAPDPFVHWGDSFEVDREWFEPSGEYALALVRADRFAIGEYDGRERHSVTGFESDVKGAHSKGGFSQARFERRRDAQIDEHLSAAREAIEDRDTERLYVVGESTLLPEFADVATVTHPSDATGKPTAALEEAYADFWSVQLTLL
ncbi:MAG: Vms1/Ankzf1 family peptidyl-tRNA hydrolase [Halobacteriota archaeon]